MRDWKRDERPRVSGSIPDPVVRDLEKTLVCHLHASLVLTALLEEFCRRNRGKPLILVQIQMHPRIFLSRPAKKNAVCKSAKKQCADEVASLLTQSLGREADD